MKLSVVILNYNVRHFLELCLCSVEKATKGLDTEIIVADNNSSDDSCAMVRVEFPGVKLIENKENLGFAKGNNAAVEQAQGEYICILNPDMVVPENLFRELLDFASDHPKMGAVGCKLIDGSGQFLPESKRNVPTVKVALGKLTGSSKGYYADHIEVDHDAPVDILVGAIMFMKKAVYKEVGGFDEAYFMYGEDIDLSYTLLKKGYQNWYL
ncbi:MAG: glycosyltransferase family 2 protein, partial [Bacteroidia bacterium]|nr:glycosyltransferase family 2 protein [Bacteroidia bacterium]